MSSTHAYQNIRRGAVIALYGFALSFLAVLLSARATSAISVSYSDPYSLVVETMAAWMHNPLGLFEVLAYTGLGIAILGLIRYWLVDPLLNWFDVERYPDNSRFEFENEASTEDGDDIDPENHEYDRVSGANPGLMGHEFRDQSGFGSAPVAELAEADFLRSPSVDESPSDEAEDVHETSVLAEIRYSVPESRFGEKYLISDGAIEVSRENPDSDDGSAIREALGLTSEDDSAAEDGGVDEPDRLQQSTLESTHSTVRLPKSKVGSRQSSEDVAEGVSEASSESSEPPISSAISAIRAEGENLADTLEEAFDFDTSRIDRAIDSIDDSQSQ